MPMFRPTLLGLLLLSACGTNSAIERSQAFARVGDHERAFKVLDEVVTADRQAGEAPNQELQAAHRSAEERFLLERARGHIFAEKEDAALADLARLERLAPGYPGAATLRERATYKKAVDAVQQGDERLLGADLEGALKCYLAAEALLPGYKPAIEGSEKVRMAMADLSKRAQSQFLEAVRKLPEFRYIEVRWHAEIALANEPDRKDAEQLQEKAQRQIALETEERGRTCLEANQYGAALIEFRAARKIDPTLPGIDERIAGVEKEIETQILMEKAQVAMRSGHFDVAREDLAKAFEMSTMARGDISELMIQTRKLEGKARYQAARDLEILGRKSEALAAYEALAKEWPEGLEDEAARIDGLRIDIGSATDEWNAAEAAEKAGDLPGALLHYETALRFYPGWKDGAERVEKLKQAGGAGDDGKRQ